MKAIYKYVLNITPPETVVNIPAGSIVRRVAMQNGEPTFWAEVDTSAPKVSKIFRILGTGHEIPENAHWVGSCEDGPFIWHLFQMFV